MRFTKGEINGEPVAGFVWQELHRLPGLSDVLSNFAARRRIVVWRGAWWYVDSSNRRAARLDGLFAKCGWNVSRICGALGLKERTFARMVEQSLGIHPKDWLCRQRALAACALLREVGTVAPVATMLGFRHGADFAAEFRRMVGVAPSEYLKSERSRMFGAVTDVKM